MAAGLGGRNGELVFNEGEFYFYKMKRVLEMDGGDGCMTVRTYLMPVGCALKNG